MEETVEDYYIHWGNRVGSQWLGCLIIPPPVVSRTRLFPLHNAVVSQKACSDESPIPLRLSLHTSWFDRMVRFLAFPVSRNLIKT